MFRKMAESMLEEVVENVETNVVAENVLDFECPVCLQNCVHPSELPCGHVFCYLCIKGIVNHNRKCAMCRRDIPSDFLDKPKLLKPIENRESQNSGDGCVWFYEGQNGWWQYDERTNEELESAYRNKDKDCELLIAGILYIADFSSMVQYRQNNPSKRRRIKRDLATIKKLGIAGLNLFKGIIPENDPNSLPNMLIPGIQNLHISNRPVHYVMGHTRDTNFSTRVTSRNRYSGYRQPTLHRSEILDEFDIYFAEDDLGSHDCEYHNF